MRAQFALGPSQVHLKLSSIDLEERIRALIQEIVQANNLETLNEWGAELERLLALERTLLPVCIRVRDKK
jgi:hypothetical protein